MSEAYDTYYGSNIESWLDDFESHALEFAQDILSELPHLAGLSVATWAQEQRQTIEQSEPIQSYLRLINLYVDEDEEEEDDEADDGEDEEESTE